MKTIINYNSIIIEDNKTSSTNNEYPSNPNIYTCKDTTINHITFLLLLLLYIIVL